MRINPPRCCGAAACGCVARQELRRQMNQVIEKPRVIGERPPAAVLGIEQFVYDDAIVRKFLVAMYAWAIVAMLVGLIVALQLVFPRLSFGSQYLSFGRLRPL